MQEITTIPAKTRALGRSSLRKLKKEGMIPAVLFGKGIESTGIALNMNEFKKLSSHLGESTIIDLTIDSAAPVKALVSHIQRDPVTDDTIHVDFRQIKMDEEIETEIELVVFGEAPVVKALGGILVQSLEAVKVKCLPTALVDNITVDAGSLTGFESRIYVKDLIVPPGIKILANADDIVVSISEPEEEAVAEAVTMNVDDVKKVGDEKKTDEDGEPVAEEKKEK